MVSKTAMSCFLEREDLCRAEGGDERKQPGHGVSDCCEFSRKGITTEHEWNLQSLKRIIWTLLSQTVCWRESLEGLRQAVSI